MSLTEKIGKGIKIASVVGGLASAGAGFYYLDKYHTHKETASEYVEEKRLEEEMSRLRGQVFDCIPATYGAQIPNDCIDKKLQHISLEQEWYKLQLAVFKASEKTSEYHVYSFGFLFVGVLGSLLLYIMGHEVADIGRRRREEEE